MPIAARIALCAFMALTMFVEPAHAAERKVPKGSFVKQLEAIALKAETGKRCNFVRRRFGLFDSYPAYLVDDDGMKAYAEYKFVPYPQGVVSFSRILPENDESKCKLERYVVVTTTGALDVGAYENCDGADGIRMSDAYAFDPVKSVRFGHEYKDRWQAMFTQMMQRMTDIAAKCAK